MITPGTLFIDIDGTILSHPQKLCNILLHNEQIVLPGVLEQLEKWRSAGNDIVLVSARPKTMEGFTKTQLERLGIVYDFLLLGLNSGPRFLINDTKPGYYGEVNADNMIEGKYYYETARSYTVKRDCGIEDINIDQPTYSFIKVKGD